jgi:lipopolysaccharide transport system ATP-binding protein
MNKPAIEVTNLGKSYLIGHTSTKKHDLLSEKLVHNIKSIYQSSKRIFKGEQLIDGDEIEEFWALNDLSFNINHGERVAIIGRNGAGKSTLLKVLSRITEPSTGKITIRGRVASLLEVGTGFHKELSGRENIYLNGSILGMSRKEISQKFDEIVSFSEVGKFIDTPVKRYSSGMYVRLAFAIAAHLDPDILIVDEVLAVGDAEFQKKCLGKMKDVSTAGRTVLFVSHNMGAIQELCERGIFLENGKVLFDGPVDEAIGQYISKGYKQAKFEFNKKEVPAQLIAVSFLKNGRELSETFDIQDTISLQFVFSIRQPGHDSGFGFSLYREGTPVFEVYSTEAEDKNYNTVTGEHIVEYNIPPMLLKEGIYSLSLGSWGHNLQMYYNGDETPTFEVLATTVNTEDKSYRRDRKGSIIDPGNWKYAGKLN